MQENGVLVCFIIAPQRCHRESQAVSLAEKRQFIRKPWCIDAAPKMEMWMPISPKVAIVLVRDKEQKIPLRVVDCPDHIRKVNEYAMRKSIYIASHSEKLLKSLINQ